MTNSNLDVALKEFDEEHIGLSPGTLSFVVTVTRNLRDKAFPVSADDFRTAQEGQVAGLGGGAIRRILADHGVTRILSSEGGRTSRGNMGKMHAYIRVLNDLHDRGLLNLDAAEKYWVERVKIYFASEPFSFRLDPSKSLRFCIRHVLKQAEDRQRGSSGTMYHGLVMQHLVGAKIDLLLDGKQQVDHHGAFVADAPRDRSGDFLIGDVAVHVTTAPSDALMRKATHNLEHGLRPIIVTTEDGVGGAKALARAANIEDRIDVIEIEQFLAANLYEWSEFKGAARPDSVRDLLGKYNEIVGKCETDPSLRIEFGQ